MRNPRLIYDIGAHKGDDTAFYLKKGFDVVAVEAHPHHARLLRARFPDEIEDGRLVLIDKGIHFRSGTVDFYAHKHDDWSSFVKTHRFTLGTFTTIPVEVIPFADIVNTYGVPYYLKADIENSELAVFSYFPNLPVFPKFVSLEHHFNDPECLKLLIRCGYDQFKLVDQKLKNFHPLPNPPLEGSHVDCKFTGFMSGAFGEETLGKWLSIDELLNLAEDVQREWSPSKGSWYDVHARHPT